MTGIRDLIKTYKALAEPDRVAADVIREHQNQHFAAVHPTLAMPIGAARPCAATAPCPPTVRTC